VLKRLITFNKENNFKNLRLKSTLKQKRKASESKALLGILATTSNRGRIALSKLNAKPFTIYATSIFTTLLKPPQSCAKIYSISINNRSSLAKI
jgi:hypothetical protein